MKDDKPVYYTREEELAGEEKDPIKALDHLADNFIFKVNTGVSALYIGAEGYQMPRKPQVIFIDGHEIHTAGGCVLRRLDEKRVVLDPENKTKKKEDYEENVDPESIK